MHDAITRFALVFTALALFGCGGSPPDERTGDQIIGVKIYDHEGDLSALFDTWRALGVNTVFASVSLHSKDEFRCPHGQAGADLGAFGR